MRRLTAWELYVLLVSLSQLTCACLPSSADEQVSDVFSDAITQVTASATPPFAIIGGGKSFGMSANDCQFTFTTAHPADSQNSIATMDICGWGLAGCTRSNQGTFTAEGEAQLFELAAALKGHQLSTIYGCPDCRDDGASQINLILNNEPINITYEFGNPPTVLHEVDAFSTSVIAALNECISNENITVNSASCIR